MTSDENFNPITSTTNCVVCGKVFTGKGAFAEINDGKIAQILCSPKCMMQFECRSSASPPSSSPPKHANQNDQHHE